MFKHIKKYSKTSLFLILTLLVSQAFAQYEINKHSINNGGGKMTGGNFQMNSSIGQVDASTIQTGGNFTLNGGFWYKADTDPKPELIFVSGFE
jgi:hypothetical protein